jgi:hypothetical protein
MLLVFLPDNAGELNSYQVVTQEAWVRIRRYYSSSHIVRLRQDIMHVRHFVLTKRFVSSKLDNAVQVHPQICETNDSDDHDGIMEWFQYTRDL